MGHSLQLEALRFLALRVRTGRRQDLLDILNGSTGVRGSGVPKSQPHPKGTEFASGLHMRTRDHRQNTDDS